MSIDMLSLNIPCTISGENTVYTLSVCSDMHTVCTDMHRVHCTHLLGCPGSTGGDAPIQWTYGASGGSGGTAWTD